VSGDPGGNGPLAELDWSFSLEQVYFSMDLDESDLLLRPATRLATYDLNAQLENARQLESQYFDNAPSMVQALDLRAGDETLPITMLAEGMAEAPIPASRPITLSSLERAFSLGLQGQWDGLFAMVAVTGTAANKVFPVLVVKAKRNFTDWLVTAGALEVALLTGLLVAFRLLDRRRRRLEHEASHDGLTGLLNHSAAVAALEKALARAARAGGLTAVLFIDLDRFKQANDTHGHQAGDLILRKVSERLSLAVRTGDLVARRGGDEFIVIAECVNGREEAQRLAERVLAVIREPIGWGGYVIEVGASVGVAITEEGRSDAERLLACADHVMYQSKRRGGGTVELYDDRALAR
jgi:diguanylate cyclase (GGDEF)-like protein